MRVPIGIIVFFLAGCTPYYVSQPTTDYAAVDPRKYEPEKGVPLAVNQYLDSIYSLNEYTAYSFGEVITVKHAEIIKLDGMLDFREKLPLMEEYYGDTLDRVIAMANERIAAQKEYLKENKILPGYRINHIFKTYENGFPKLYEADFFTDFQYRITDVKYKMKATLTREEEDLFYYYFMRYPWIEFSDAAQTSSFNEKLFAIYDDALEKEVNLESKELLLKNILQIQKYFKTHNDVDPNNLTRHLAKYWIAINAPVKTELYAERFSELQTIAFMEDTVAVTAGYGIFVEYSYKEATGVVVKKAGYFEFDLNFLFRNVVILEDEYEEYFK